MPSGPLPSLLSLSILNWISLRYVNASWCSFFTGRSTCDKVEWHYEPDGNIIKLNRHRLYAKNIFIILHQGIQTKQSNASVKTVYRCSNIRRSIDALLKRGRDVYCCGSVVASHQLEMELWWGLTLLLSLLAVGRSQKPHKRFEYKYSFKGPYLAQKDNQVPFWHYSGSE